MASPVRRSQNLRDLLELRVQDCPGGERGYHFHSGSGQPTVETLTYEGLADRSKRWAAGLQAFGAEGERCLLLFPPGTEYISAFFACLYAGAVAVPTYPPSRRNVDGRFRAVLDDAEPRVILCTPEIRDRVLALAGEWPGFRAARIVTPAELEAADESSWTPPALDSDSLAFLQYTSGSTGQPKGVRVTHGNLVHNQQLIQTAFGTSSESVVVGWLPLYHDMGLIGIVLQPLFVGAECHLMSPLAFLQRPLAWLELISRVGGTVSGGPSFAYGLCVEKAVAGCPEDLDLSRWRVAFNGSEPVDATTLERFAETFATYGFRPQAAYPCYGLAEATLFVAGASVAEPPTVESFDQAGLGNGRAVPLAGGRSLVSSGRPADGLDLAIVDPETCRRLADGEVGEIWVAGQSVADGYWRRRRDPKRDFGARLEDHQTHSPQRSWLRTGDLGFLRHGELFVSGRIKDLIILRGRNVYPQDVERAAAASHPALLADGAAAFAVDSPRGEGLVVVQEIDRRHHDQAAQALEALGRGLAEHEGLVADEIVLIRQRTLPRTSSGKVRRRACRQAYLDGALEAVATAARRTGDTRPEASWSVGMAGEDRALDLRLLVARRLGRDPADLDPDSDLVTLGLDSLAAMELAGEVESRLGVHLPLEVLVEGTSLAALQQRIDEAGEGPASGGGAHDPGEPTERPSVGQASIYFLERLQPAAARYNVARALRCTAPGQVGRLIEGLDRVVESHDELRRSFAVDDQGWLRRGWRPGPRLEVREQDASGWSAEALTTALVGAASRPFDLARDPLMRLEVFRGAGDDVVLWVAHHLVVDFLSMATIGRQLSEGWTAISTPPGPPKAGYDAWIRWQEDLLAGERGQSLREFWRRELADAPAPPELPVDSPPPAERSWRARCTRAWLPDELWSAVRDRADRQGATPFVLLFAALQLLIARIGGQRDFLLVSPVATPGPLPLGEPVGYRVNLLPLRSALDESAGFEDLVRGSRRRVNEALRHRDLPFAHIVEEVRGQQPRSGRAEGSGSTADGAGLGLGRVMLVLYGRSAGSPSGLAELAAGVPGSALDLPGARFETLELETHPALFDLQLHATELASGGCYLGLDTDRELFDRVTGERLLRWFQRLLEGATAAPTRPLRDLSLLDGSEREQLLAAGLGPAPAPGLRRPVLSRIAARIHSAPEAPALE
ncbi:MAG: AMP-binding protein, partial [Acidobacteria bacterium]|nr:AMP-binding protein [Acidobacteriota bacterium]